MGNSKKALVFLIMNLAVVGYAFYYYLKGIPLAIVAIMTLVSALIFNLLSLFVWRVASKRSGGNHPAKDS